MNDYKEYLNVAVIQEKKPVTYKTLARSLGIHVNTAKQALYEFSTENQQTVHAVYCLTGRTMKNDQFNIQLVKATELEEIKKSFKQITGIHVYSVSSSEPLDFSILYAACKDTMKLSLEDRVKCGVFKNNRVTIKKSNVGRPVETRTPQLGKSFAKATPVPAKATPTKDNAAGPVKRKGTLMFGPATTKKQAVAAPKAEKSEPTPKPTSMFNTKKSVGKQETDAEDIEMRLAKTTIKPEDIFSDDEEEEEEEEPKPEEPEFIDLEDDLMEEVEVRKTEATPSPSPSPPPEPTPSPPPPTLPGQTKRKVLRKKTTKNARGFLVTEEVWEWEVVDESEVPKAVAPAKPKPAASKSIAAKKAVKKGGGPAQTDLFSFFKKK